MIQYPACEVLEKRAAACYKVRVPAVKDITRPPGTKQANHITAPGNPRSAPLWEVAQTNLGHDPNPPARIAPMDASGMAGSRAGGQDTHNTPNLFHGAST